MERYGQKLITPLGLAAGPHTQMALNIVAGWLCGARYIELKTVQTLDELDVPKPCIDMQDEGYNCEWSQELKTDQTFREYLHAWALIHILHRELGFKGPVGTLFNMSIGYNLEGILKRNVQQFLNAMVDPAESIAQLKHSIRDIYPRIAEIEIPGPISNHVTLSTMHGCPPDEIEKIGLYLILEKKLHTTIKLNPTLLGPGELREILNDTLGFATQVPDEAFAHDLKYPDALTIIDSLLHASRSEGLRFGVKLTNTLESLNNKNVFDNKEPMMYLSGRALHPISIQLAKKLQNDFSGNLDISFSAGADCFNISEILSCGLRPVTVCTDLLKPGGYGRLWQYIDHLKNGFHSLNAASIEEFVVRSSGNGNLDPREAALLNLNRYAKRVVADPAYHKANLFEPDIKTERSLPWFDCIEAPCTIACPANQDIPAYMYHTSRGDLPSAFETIFDTNPFPSVTGMVCDHPCQLKCTRVHYDTALHIREIKRFVAENTNAISPLPLAVNVKKNGKKAAIIGAGPAGLSCGWFLNLLGFDVYVYEQKKIAGGMVSAAIPSFRLTGKAIEQDIQRILNSGIALQDNYRVDKTNFMPMIQHHDMIFIATGAQRSVPLNIEGIKAEGVLDPLEFLMQVKNNQKPQTGNHIVIIGGGNTAMDAARTAFRLVGAHGKVTVVYRRTIHEMPADKGEIEAVIAEGIEIIELVQPERVKSVHGHVASVICSRNTLFYKSNNRNERPLPVAIPGSEFEIPCDTLIPAIGQQPILDFMDGPLRKRAPGSFHTQTDGIFIGGDAMRGASTAINAIADGRKAAAEMASWSLKRSMNPDWTAPIENKNPLIQKNDKIREMANFAELMHKKAIRIKGVDPIETPLSDRKNFNIVSQPYAPDDAQKEASRCLLCDRLCNTCVTVCPNLANFSYTIAPVYYRLQKAVKNQDGSLVFSEDCDFIVQQPFQVLNLRDLCNECGNCTTFCPTSGRPFADKPGLSLSVETFNRETQGFFLSSLPDKDILIYKEKGNIKTLYLQDGKYHYETEQVRAVLDANTFAPIEVFFQAPCIREYHFTFAAEMSIVLKGAMQLKI